MQQLEHLIYASSPQRNFTEEALLEMLQGFRVNNERLNITGLLLYDQGKFMQYLEGPAPSLNSLVREIQVDDRHSNFRILSEGPISERLFTTWAMAYKSLRGVTSDQVPGYREILHHPGNTDLSSLELLTLFRELSPESLKQKLA